jgi:hypothetical protein
VTRPAVPTNQVNRAGAFSAVDSTGQPLRLQRAGLTGTGFEIVGSGWEIASRGALTSQNTTLVPGQMIRITGKGLQRLTTAGVYILSTPVWVAAGVVSYENEFTVEFQIPALPPGQHTLQINAVRQGQLPMSLGVGFTLGSASPAIAPVVKKATDSADFITFTGSRTALSPTAKSKLRRIAKSAQGSTVDVSIIGLPGRSGSTLAQQRSTVVSRYLESQGVRVTARPALSPRSSARSGVLVSVSSPPTAPARGIDSLIVRFAPQQEPAIGDSIAPSLTVRKYLGFRMYRVDFPAPVSEDAAIAAAAALAKNPAVEFAEPDARVTTQVTASGIGNP